MGSKEINYKELIGKLHYARQYTNDVIGVAINAIETLLTERNTLHAHVVTNWLGSCYCSNCKGNIDYTSSYCNWCGAKLDEPEERE